MKKFPEGRLKLMKIEQQTLHLQSHEFDDNQSTLEIIVAQEPRFVVIDPQLMTIDRDLGDNQFELVLSR